MKLSLLALLASITMALATKGKSFLVTFPDDTPQSVVDDAIDAIVKSGGVIGHKYTLLKGFSVVANPDVMTSFRTKGNEKYPPTVEEDQVVYALNDDHSPA